MAAFLLVVSVSSTVAEHETSREMEKSERDAKALPIFQVVKFPVSLPEIPHSINILITLEKFGYFCGLSNQQNIDDLLTNSYFLIIILE